MLVYLYCCEGVVGSGGVSVGVVGMRLWGVVCMC